MKRLAASLVAALTMTLVPALPAGAAVTKVKVASCPSSTKTCWPAAFAFTPDGGTIFWAERFTGRIKRTVLATGTTSTWFRLRGVARDGEQGILGIAVDPDWPADGWVYVYFTKRSPLENRIIRIRSLGGGSFEKDRLLRIPASSFHNGGVIHFGPDGMLYAVTGDAGRPGRAQRKKNEAGKILRMTETGGIPGDNPFAGSHAYSRGHRNSFGFAFDPFTDRLWQSENGPQCDDEMNRIRRGRNFGWGAASSCPRTSESGPRPIQPKKRWNPVMAPTGVAFCDGCGLSNTHGRLLVGSFLDRKIRKLALTNGRRSVGAQGKVYRNRRGILALEAAPDGRVYFSDKRGIYRLDP